MSGYTCQISTVLTLALIVAPVAQTFTPLPGGIDITFGNKDVAGRGLVRTMGYLELGKDQLEPTNHLLQDKKYVVVLNILPPMHALVEFLAEMSQLYSWLSMVCGDAVRISLSHKIRSV